jgi:hypothetical protein
MSGIRLCLLGGLFIGCSCISCAWRCMALGLGQSSVGSNTYIAVAFRGQVQGVDDSYEL